MKIKFLTLLIILISAASVIIFDINNTPSESQDIVAKNIVTNKVPDFMASLLDGGEIKISNVDSKIIVVSFWASWCAICAKEFPDMLELVKKSANNITLLAISIDEDKEKALAFRKKLFKRHSGISNIDNVYWALDSDKNISLKIFNTIKTPETIIIDQNRNMVKKIVGLTKWNAGETKEFIDSLL